MLKIFCFIAVILLSGCAGLVSVHPEVLKALLWESVRASAFNPDVNE